jgi:5-methylcytosine-specific restriction protein A
MAWSTGRSARAERLPRDWYPRIRPRILRRDPACCLAYPCSTQVSTQVDHVEAGDDHSDHNLQGVCGPCHAIKSSAEGHAAKPQRKRAVEQHPGVIR